VRKIIKSNNFFNPTKKQLAPYILSITALFAVTPHANAEALFAVTPHANAEGATEAPGLSEFVILSTTAAVTCTDSTIMGDVASPVSVTQTNCHHAGEVNIPVPVQVLNDFDKKYSDLADFICPPDNYLTTLAGETLSPGTYCFDQASTNTDGVLTLEGNGNSDDGWVFKIDVGALTATDFVVKMTNGGEACNVDWRVAEAATITRGDFIGNIYAGSAITVTGAAPTSPFRGRALARAGVTLTNSHFKGCVSKQTPPVCEIEQQNDVVFVRYAEESSLYEEREIYAAVTLDRKNWYTYNYARNVFLGPFTESTRDASSVKIEDPWSELHIDLNTNSVTECSAGEDEGEMGSRCEEQPISDSSVEDHLDIVQMLVGHIFNNMYGD